MASSNSVDRLTVNEVVEEIEKMALDICKSNGQPNNENDSWEERDTLTSALKGKKRPGKALITKLAFTMLDFYIIEPLLHEHDSKNELIVKTIKQAWARKGIASISSRIEEAWQELHNQVEENNDMAIVKDEETRVSTRRGRPRGSLKNRLVEGTKNAATKTLIRKGSRAVTEAMQGLVVNLLMSGADATDPSFKAKVGELMKTDIGHALTAGMISVLLEVSPISIPGLSEETKAALIEELQVNCIDSGTRPIENMVKMFVPMLTSSLTPLLNPASAAVAETPLISPTKDETPAVA